MVCAHGGNCEAIVTFDKVCIGSTDVLIVVIYYLARTVKRSNAFIATEKSAISTYAAWERNVVIVGHVGNLGNAGRSTALGSVIIASLLNVFYGKVAVAIISVK